MHPALTGAIVGLGIALAMVLFDYMLVKRRAAERAVRQHKKVAEFDETDKGQMISLLRYCIFLPAGFAVLFWALA